MAALTACTGTSPSHVADSVDTSPDDISTADTPPEDTSPDDTSSDTPPDDTSPEDTSSDTPPEDTSPDDTSTDTPPDDTSDPTPRCTRGDLAFIDLPEASGAAPLDTTHYLVVADSGHSGRALVRSDAVSIPLTLPLGEGAGDDVEGLARSPDGLIYGLTSSGYLRVWRVEQADGAWSATLVYGPSPIAERGEWVGRPRQVNGAANFEGICLHPSPTPGHCVGWAASKARGELVCLRADEGLGLRLDPLVRVPVFDPEHLSDCAYEDTPPHRLFAAGNVYSGDQIREVRPEGPAPEVPLLELGPDQVGSPNQEAILVRGRPEGFEIHSFGDWQDLGGDRSPWTLFTCAP